MLDNMQSHRQLHMHTSSCDTWNQSSIPADLSGCIGFKCVSCEGECLCMSAITSGEVMHRRPEHDACCPHVHPAEWIVSLLFHRVPFSPLSTSRSTLPGSGFSFGLFCFLLSTWLHNLIDWEMKFSWLKKDSSVKERLGLIRKSGCPKRYL